MAPIIIEVFCKKHSFLDVCVHLWSNMTCVTSLRTFGPQEAAWFPYIYNNVQYGARSENRRHGQQMKESWYAKAGYTRRTRVGGLDLHTRFWLLLCPLWCRFRPFRCHYCSDSDKQTQLRTVHLQSFRFHNSQGGFVCVFIIDNCILLLNSRNTFAKYTAFVFRFVMPMGCCSW